MTASDEIAVYDGQRHLGYVIKHAGRYRALDVDGRRLGTFASSVEAANAVDSAAKSSMNVTAPV